MDTNRLKLYASFFLISPDETALNAAVKINEAAGKRIWKASKIRLQGSQRITQGNRLGDLKTSLPCSSIGIGKHLSKKNWKCRITFSASLFQLLKIFS